MEQYAFVDAIIMNQLVQKVIDLFQVPSDDPGIILVDLNKPQKTKLVDPKTLPYYILTLIELCPNVRLIHYRAK
ncbi:hypothetical protein KM622_gp090 [Spodoptera exempta nucleopolyhedrovirus]|uniref:Uncharacterized protein n=1 Tax=Spodoptera exempta nucleopolyhedrovirus TaxID=1242863 RepID=A0A410S7T2_9ABAC|nr:hypothetical protein KM622_gp090 [Spodoptera exempta nucleopolyhedrovirus]QAT90376.1 hypothetical protein [Spodoptera exempta nucleopolyhedrovirus]